MRRRVPVCRLSLVGLALAGALHAQGVLAQPEGAGDFLAAVGGVSVPPEVPVRPAGGAPASASSALLRENRGLKARMAELMAKEKDMAQAAKAAAGDSHPVAVDREAAHQRAALKAKLASLQDDLQQQAAQLRLAQTGRERAEKDTARLRAENQTLLKKDALDKTHEAGVREREQLRQALAQAGSVQAQLDAQQKAGRTEAEAALTKLAALQKQVPDLETERTLLAQQTQGLTQERDGLKQQLATQEKQARDMRGQNAALTREVAGLKATVSTAQLEARRAQDQLAAMTAADGQLTRLAQEKTALAGQVETLTEQNAGLNASLAAAQREAGQSVAKVKASVKADADAARELADRVDTLTRQLSDLTAERDALKAGVADAPPAVVPTKGTEAQQRAYAGGVMLSGAVRRTLTLQKALGVSVDVPMLLAGMVDGVNGRVRLNDKVLDARSQALVKQMSSLEEQKYRASEKTLAALTRGKTLLKQNRSLWFVRAKKSSGEVKAGDTVRFSYTEENAAGRVLRHAKGVNATVDNTLPYIIAQALMLAGRGGGVDVYCLAADVYPPDKLPEGVFGYSVLKYTFRLENK